MREWQVDVEPELFQCSEGITVSGVGDSERYMVGTVANSGAGISCVSEATICPM